jgi:hypothetical protein
MKSSLRLMAFAVFAVFMFFSGSPVVGQYNCNLSGLVCKHLSNGLPDSSCPKADTSLPIANGGSAGYNLGWYDNGTQCGIDIHTFTPCGDKLGFSCCNCDSYFYGWPCDLDPAYPGCEDSGGGGGCLRGTNNKCAYGAVPIAASTPAAQVVGRLNSIAQQALPPTAEQMLSALAQLSSVHLVARASVTMRNPAAAHATPARSTADYEYWESGSSYRIRNTLDPKFGLVDVPEWAFDGTRHQILLGAAAANSVLSVHRGDERATFFPLENPLFLTLSYLSLADAESCVLCELRLADLQYLAGLRAGALEPSTFASPAETASGEGLVLAGGRSYESGHQLTHHRVALDVKGHVISIQTVDEAGHVLRKVDLADFRPVAGLDVELPRAVTLSKSSGGDVSPWFVVRYEIGTLEINQPIPRSTFNLITQPQVHKVWDSDFNTFVKYEQVPGDAICPKNGAN